MIPKENIQEDNKKLSALIQLIDDPDEQTYNAVAKALISMHNNALPALENRLEVSNNVIEIERIEELIEIITVNITIREFKDWRSNGKSIVEAMFLIAKTNNRNIDYSAIMSQYRKIKQNIWLEIHSFQTPLEKINAFVVIIYNYYNILGKELYHFNENHFYLDSVFNDKKGNAYSLGALSLAIAQDLDIPLFPLLLPHQFLLGYFKHLESFMPDLIPAEQNIAFYFEPTHAHIFSQIDINNYLKKIDERYNKEYFNPMSNESFIAIVLQELAVCLDNNGAYIKSFHIRQIIHEAFGDLMHLEQ